MEVVEVAALDAHLARTLAYLGQTVAPARSAVAIDAKRAWLNEPHAAAAYHELDRRSQSGSSSNDDDETPPKRRRLRTARARKPVPETLTGKETTPRRIVEQARAVATVAAAGAAGAVRSSGMATVDMADAADVDVDGDDASLLFLARHAPASPLPQVPSASRPTTATRTKPRPRSAQRDARSTARARSGDDWAAVSVLSTLRTGASGTFTSPTVRGGGALARPRRRGRPPIADLAARWRNRLTDAFDAGTSGGASSAPVPVMLVAATPAAHPTLDGPALLHVLKVHTCTAAHGRIP
jgi:hypothetical protein